MRTRRPLNADKNFAFWSISDNHFVSLAGGLRCIQTDNDSLLLVDDQEVRASVNGVSRQIISCLASPVTLLVLMDSLKEYRSSVIYRELHELWLASLVDFWQNKTDAEFAAEVALSTHSEHLGKSLSISIFNSNISDGFYETLCDALREVGVDLNLGCPRGTETHLLLVNSMIGAPTRKLLQAASNVSAVVPIAISNHSLWVGPYFARGDAGRIEAFSSRLRANFPSADWIAEASPENAQPSKTAAWVSRASPSLIARLLVARLFEESHESLMHNLVTLDFRSLAIRSHPISSIYQTQQHRYKIETSWLGDDGGIRGIAPADFLKHTKDLLSPITGLVPDLSYHAPAPGMHVYRTIQIEPQPISYQANRRIGSRFGAAGKGETEDQSKASCIGEALERYSACFQGNEAQSYFSLVDAKRNGSIVIDPREVLLFSELQYANKSNLEQFSIHFVPEPFDPHESVSWFSGKRYKDGETAFAPTSLILFNFNELSGTQQREFCFADSNGCAVGMSFQEALLHAVCELIERDACSIWWYNKIRRPKFDLSKTNRRYIREAPERFRGLDRDFAVLDLTADLGIPVACAVSWKRDGREIGVGLGCDVNPEVAVSRAISELSQFVSGIDTVNSENVDQKYEADIVAWINEAELAGHSYLEPLGVSDRLSVDTSRQISTIEGQIEYLAERLAQNNLELYSFDLSRPETGVHCARAVIPGLRHFWKRLAPGRLYDVPVGMGWQSRRLQESELNSIPFFL